MFWKNRNSGHSELIPQDIVSRAAAVYADLNELGLLVKPRSKLPAPYFIVRQAFMTDYEENHAHLSEAIKDSYHHVYGELAFFIDDDLCASFNSSLETAAQCRMERMQKLGIQQDLAFSKLLLASISVRIQDRDVIWNNLKQETSCPRQDLLVLFGTLNYCAETFRTCWDEWAAFANFVSHRNTISES